jgi:hypothetical protein
MHLYYIEKINIFTRIIIWIQLDIVIILSRLRFKHGNEIHKIIYI